MSLTRQQPAEVRGPGGGLGALKHQTLSSTKEELQADVQAAAAEAVAAAESLRIELQKAKAVLFAARKRAVEADSDARVVQAMQRVEAEVRAGVAEDAAERKRAQEAAVAVAEAAEKEAEEARAREAARATSEAEAKMAFAAELEAAAAEHRAAAADLEARRQAALESMVLPTVLPSQFPPQHPAAAVEAAATSTALQVGLQAPPGMPPAKSVTISSSTVTTTVTAHDSPPLGFPQPSKAFQSLPKPSTAHDPPPLGFPAAGVSRSVTAPPPPTRSPMRSPPIRSSPIRSPARLMPPGFPPSVDPASDFLSRLQLAEEHDAAAAATAAAAGVVIKRETSLGPSSPSPQLRAVHSPQIRSPQPRSDAEDVEPVDERGRTRHMRRECQDCGIAGLVDGLMRPMRLGSLGPPELGAPGGGEYGFADAANQRPVVGRAVGLSSNAPASPWSGPGSPTSGKQSAGWSQQLALEKQQARQRGGMSVGAAETAA